MSVGKDDAIHRATKWVDYNRWQVILPVVMIAGLLVLAGCPAKTPSVYPADGAKVTAKELQRQYNEFLADQTVTRKAFALAQEDLAEQEARKAALYDLAAQLARGAATGTLPPLTALIPTVLLGAAGAWGIGARIDKTRTDKKLAESKKA